MSGIVLLSCQGAGASNGAAMSEPFILRRTDNGVETRITTDLIAGRRADCGLVLPPGGSDGGPSRRHARLSVGEGRLWVEDLSSKNGTFVNGQRVPDHVRTPLRPGDRLRFDQVEFVVRFTAADADTLELPPRRPAIPPVTQPAAALSAPPAVPPAAGRSFLMRGAPGSVAWVAAARGTRTVDPQAFDQALKPDPAAAPGQVTEPSLRVLSGPLAGTCFPLVKAGGAPEETCAWSIGSQSGQDILLTGTGVSAEHARIIRRKHRWAIVDQLSRSGTYVNGRRSPASGLASGDIVVLGTVQCMFELPGRVRASRARPAWLTALVAAAVGLSVLAGTLAVWHHRSSLASFTHRVRAVR